MPQGSIWWALLFCAIPAAAAVLIIIESSAGLPGSWRRVAAGHVGTALKI